MLLPGRRAVLMPRFDTGRPAVVTGGAGAIGAVLVRALLDRGIPVRVLDNFSSGRREHLPDPAKEPLLTVRRADIRHLGEIESTFKGAGSVWHLAANPDIRLGTEQPQLDLEHGTIGTSNVLEASRRGDVPHVLFSSSSVIYGYPTKFPTPEAYGPLFPQSLYGASKLASEGLLSAYSGCFGIHATIFRFANIIGPTMTHGVIYDFFEKLRATPERLEVLGDGRQAKSYLRVEDCVSAMLVAAEKGREPVEAYNLGTVERTSVRAIAERVVAATGGRARIEYTGGERGWAGDISQQHLAIDRICALGWKPQWESTAAVERTVAEFAPRFH
jgi:UDP-glucose 4-epimerase